MKRLAIAAAAAFVVLTGAAYAQTTTRIGTEGAYAPWNFVNADGKLAGFDIDVGNELCKRAGLQCEFIQTAWDTIIPNLNAGNFDIIMAGMSITDERKAAIDFTADYSPPETSSFLSAAATAFDYNALKGIKIGTQGGTIQAAYADANLKDGNTLVSFETADAALADLSAGNVDLVLAARAGEKSWEWEDEEFWNQQYAEQHAQQLALNWNDRLWERDGLVAFEVNPVHLGVIFLANLELGFLCPPMGLNLFLSATRFQKPLPYLYRQALPFLAIMTVGVLFITYVESASLWLLRVLGKA